MECMKFKVFLFVCLFVVFFVFLGGGGGGGGVGVGLWGGFAFFKGNHHKRFRQSVHCPIIS